MDLQEIRKQLDSLDEKMVALYEERLKLCADVAEYKLRNGKAVLDAKREEEKLKTLREKTADPFDGEAVTELYRQIMTVSRRYQYIRMGQEGKQKDLSFTPVKELPEARRVVYQGTEGAYSMMAAEAFFGKKTDTVEGKSESAEALPGKTNPGLSVRAAAQPEVSGMAKEAERAHPAFYHVEHFEDAVKEAEEGRADYCVIPIENSSAGAVVDTYDLLMKHDVAIVGEYFLPVRHALLGLPEAELTDIRTVYSHPQGLMQCAAFLNGHRDWKQVGVENTAVAAKKVQDDGEKSEAAIASTLAGRLYGLKILAEGVNGNSNNTTRFIVLSGRKLYREDAKKISLIFELPHKSGALYNMLGNFIFNNINMVKIESRPIPEKTWEYRFFVDIEGTLKDPAVMNAVTGIASEAPAVRVLGNY